MKRIELLDEDFPFTPKTLRFLQDISVEALQELAKATGDNTILHGCNVSGGIVFEGAVVLNGEILPLETQPQKSYITVEETVEDAVYKGEVPRPAYYSRKAVLSDTGTVLFSSLQRYQEKLVPKGVIVMWSGNTTSLPAGWALCNGASGTPDLRSRFIVGFDPSDVDYNAVGKTGGAKTVTLDSSQIPAHNHPVKRSQSTAGDGNYPVNVAMGDDNPVLTASGYTADNEGGGQQHENRPPYYVLAFIIKL